MSSSFEQYFQARGIEVNYNTLASTQELIESYIYDTRSVILKSPKASKVGSNHVKYDCYKQFYDIEYREPKTGFEKFSTLDTKVRDYASRKIVTPATCLTTVNPVITPTIVTSSYTELLKKSFSAYTKPIFLYMSGGMDSEMVGRGLLDAGKKFTPVIFRWTDKSGNIQNEYDNMYAFKFCQQNQLTPIVETIDIETLWESDEFKELTKKVDVASPQIVTHAYMVDYIDNKYPNSCHLFGGEVRYFIDDESFNQPVNMVSLGKVYPIISIDGKLFAADSGMYLPVGTSANIHMDIFQYWIDHYPTPDQNRWIWYAAANCTIYPPVPNTGDCQAVEVYGGDGVANGNLVVPPYNVLGYDYKITNSTLVDYQGLTPISYTQNSDWTPMTNSLDTEGGIPKSIANMQAEAFGPPAEPYVPYAISGYMICSFRLMLRSHENAYPDPAPYSYGDFSMKVYFALSGGGGGGGD